ENWGHDFNIGSVIRTANAFNAKAFHIVGKRRWNRRGAMVTDRYQHEYHHPGVEDLIAWAAAAPGDGGAPGIPIIGVDNLPGSQPIETYDLPRHCILLFGQEGPGLSRPAREASVAVLNIAQFGSTRSINAGAAGAVAMHAWVRRHVFGQPAGS
ncbi:MAG TPA: TrmH family RNA methyltransferase, partial [Dermatophilaceae bacterium]